MVINTRKWYLISIIALTIFSFAGQGFESSDIVTDSCIPPLEEADCTEYRSPGAGHAKNVILLVGDGMGINHVVAARTYLQGPDNPLPLERLPYQGTLTTCSLSGVTDSAASGTALATGHKTYNGRISTGRDGEEWQTVLESVRSSRWTGIVSTTKIWDATPAVFAAHDISRGNAREIIEDYLKIQPEVIMGGGRHYWQGSSKYPDRIAQAKELGYTYLSTADELRGLDLSKADKLLGLFADKAMEYEYLRPESTTEPHLSDMAQAALGVLEKSPYGFFLMIEGARVDHASHAVNVKWVVDEMVEFNKTINLVLEWAQGQPNTLVLITADHECGGMEILQKDYKKGDIVDVRWHTTLIPKFKSLHSKQRVPIYGIGPNSGAIKEHQDNTAVYCIMKNAFE